MIALTTIPVVHAPKKVNLPFAKQCHKTSILEQAHSQYKPGFPLISAAQRQEQAANYHTHT
jgi:hypothetical protein